MVSNKLTSVFSSQLAEAIIRAMTALLKDQSPSKGVRLLSQYIGSDGEQDMLVDRDSAS